MSRPVHPATDEPLLWVLGLFAAAASMLWATAQLAALLSRHGPVALQAGDLPAIAVPLGQHLADPRMAFPPALRAGLPGPVLVYVSAAICLTGIAALTWALLRLVGADGSSFGSRREIREQLSLRSVRAGARQTRPSLDARRAAPNEVGLHLGRDVKTGIELCGSVEDSYLYLGPPRSGKGVNLVIPQCLAAPGAVIVTATRPDTLRATIERRRERGPIAVFDPQGV